MLWPCRPESANGVPRPRRWNSSAERLLRRVVDLVREHEHRLVREPQDLGQLLVARRDSLRARRRGTARGRPPRPRARACSAIERVIASLRSRCRRRRCRSAGIACPPTRRRAPCGRASSPRLVHDRGPRLGEAVDQRRLADVREADDRDRAEQVDAPDSSPVFFVGRASLTAAAPRREGRPRAWTSASQSKRTLQPPLDLGARLPCSRAHPSAGRRSMNGLADGDRAGGEVADLPELRAVDPRSGRPARSPGSRPSPRPAGPCPGRPLTSGASLRRRRRSPGRSWRSLPHLAHRVAVGLAASHGDDAVPGDVRVRAPAQR